MSGALMHWSAAYVGVAWLQWTVGSLSSGVAPVWPSAGLGAVAVLLLGRRGAWVAAVGELVSNTWHGTPPLVAGVMAVGDALEALLVVALWDRWDGRRALDRTRGVVSLVTAAACAVAGAGHACYIR